MREAKKNADRKGFAVLAAWLVLVFIWASPGFGEEAEARTFAFKAGAGPVFRTGESFDPGFFYYGGFFTRLSSRIGLEFLITGNRMYTDEPPAGLSPGKLATTQLLISGQYRLAQGSRFIPYVIAGLEFNFFHFWPDDEAEEGKRDIVDRFGPHFGAGLDWVLSDWLALNADVRYSILKTWVEDLPREGPIGEVNPDEVDQINLNALTLTFGLKFYF